MSASTLNLDQIQHNYLKILRAWHFAWAQREVAHRRHFLPERLDDRGLVYESVREELRRLNELEERSYDRFLQARDALAQETEARALGFGSRSRGQS